MMHDSSDKRSDHRHDTDRDDHRHDTDRDDHRHDTDRNDHHHDTVSNESRILYHCRWYVLSFSTARHACSASPADVRIY